MTEAEKWQAVAGNDKSADGVFFYAVRSTGIFCRPSCPSRLPARENVTFFDSAEQAARAGFRPCKRCRPDLLDYRPAQELAEQAKALLDTGAAGMRRLKEAMSGVGLSQRRLDEVFRGQYGVTMFEYRARLRLEQAKRELAQPNIAIVDIAYSAGFESVAAFYSFFRKGCGMTPARYRKEIQKGR